MDLPLPSRASGQAAALEERLSTYAPLSRNLAEFGTGTNERAIISGGVLED